MVLWRPRNGQTHLTGGQIVMLGHGVGGVHEDLWHGGEVLDTLHPQPQEMSVYGLPIDRLIKKHIMTQQQSHRLMDCLRRQCGHWRQASHPYIFGHLSVGLSCLPQQGDLLCILLRSRKKRSWNWCVTWCDGWFSLWLCLCSTGLAGSSMANTNFDESTVVDLITSVRPYLNIRKEALS